jgi:hypothetical protein
MHVIEHEFECGHAHVLVCHSCFLLILKKRNRKDLSGKVKEFFLKGDKMDTRINIAFANNTAKML